MYPAEEIFVPILQTTNLLKMRPLGAFVLVFLEAQKIYLHFTQQFLDIFHQTMHDKTITEFGFCYIRNNHGLSKCNQSRPLNLDYSRYHKNLIQIFLQFPTSRDRFKPIRIGENLVVDFNSLQFNNLGMAVSTPISPSVLDSLQQKLTLPSLKILRAAELSSFSMQPNHNLDKIKTKFTIFFGWDGRQHCHKTSC